MTARRKSPGRQIALAVALLCLFPNVTLGYSVLAHEAIIDSVWDTDIAPILRARFPDATPEDIRRAHAFAYGGSIIQDLGYYPFGSRFYTDLTHYVRSGEFVRQMLTDARDLNELAFAIGALSHYCADNAGHAMATNSAVALLYPELRARFGDHITYEQKRSAHIQTEFGFDVVQVARGHYASQAYRDFHRIQNCPRLARALLPRDVRPRAPKPVHRP